MKKLLLLITLTFSLITTAQEIKFGKVSKEELEEKFYPLDSTADASYLFKRKTLEYNYDGDKGWTIVTKVLERIKLYSKKGLDITSKKIKLFKSRNKEEEISSIKIYTFNLENGKVEKIKLAKKNIFKEKLNRNWNSVNFSMPNTKPFSVIDISYTIESPFASSIDKFNLQAHYPIKNLFLEIKIPDYFRTKHYTTGYLPIKIQQTSEPKEQPYHYRKMVNQAGGYRSQKISGVLKYSNIIYSINKKNVSKIPKNEIYVSNINNYKSGVKFEISELNMPNSPIKLLSTTWENVCKTIYRSSNFGEELKKTNYYKDNFSTILNQQKNEHEKITSIFQHVKSTVKWDGYYGKYTNKGVKKAYKDGVGNSAEINLILTSMLRSAGINANPVLISTRNNGSPLFPTLEGFNYVLTKVNLTNGKYVLLDATEKYSFPNILPSRTLNWYGRELLGNNSSKQVNLIPASHTKENNILFIKINEEGDVNGMLRKSLTDHSAMSYRQKNNLKKEEELINSLENDYSIDIENFKVINKDDLSKPISQSLKFSSEDFIEELNDKLYFSPLFFLATNENPFKSKERNFPVDYGIPWQDKFSVSITIPDNYIVESYPKELAIGLPENLGVFKYKILVKGNKVKLSSVLQINSSIISPQYYTALRDFYTQLVKKQSEKIVLKKN